MHIFRALFWMLRFKFKFKKIKILNIAFFSFRRHIIIIMIISTKMCKIYKLSMQKVQEIGKIDNKRVIFL